MRPSGLVLAVTVSAALVAGCGGGQPTSQAPSSDPPPPPTPSAETTGVTERPTADASTDPLWAFQAEQVSGGTFEGSPLSGRDVAVWFWAPW